MSQEPTDYGLSPQIDAPKVGAPCLDYLPPRPRSYSPRIALIGAGGITQYHLQAYRAMNLDVALICDLDLSRARARRDEFYPQAEICTDFTTVLRRDDIEVIDAAVHPEPRLPILQAAIDWGHDHELIEKLSLQVFENNRRAVRLYRSVGFQEEGRLRREVKDEGRYIDMIQMALFVNEGTRAEPKLAAAQVLVPGKGWREEPPATPEPGLRVKACAADWNGDGKLDLLVGDYAKRKPDLPATTAEQQKVHDAARAELDQLYERFGELADRLRGKDRVKDEAERAKVQEEFGKLRARMGELRASLPPEEETHGWIWLFARR